MLGKRSGLEKSDFTVGLLTVHDVRLVKVRITFVDLGSVAKLPDVVVEVPTHVLVEHGQGGVLLLVGPDLCTVVRRTSL